MEKSKDIKETHKDFRSKRGAFSRKSYDGRDGSRNRRIKGKRDGLKRKSWKWELNSMTGNWEPEWLRKSIKRA